MALARNTCEPGKYLYYLHLQDTKKIERLVPLASLKFEQKGCVLTEGLFTFITNMNTTVYIHVLFENISLGIWLITNVAFVYFIAIMQKHVVLQIFNYFHTIVTFLCNVFCVHAFQMSHQRVSPVKRLGAFHTPQHRVIFVHFFVRLKTDFEFHKFTTNLTFIVLSVNVNIIGQRTF